MDDRERIQAALGATGAVVLADGQTYRFEPLSIGDYEEVDRFVRGKALRDLAPILPTLQPSDRTYLLDKAYQEMRSMTLDELRAKASTIDVLRYMAWLMIRHNHPDVSIEDLDRLITIGNRELVERQMEAITGLADPTLGRQTTTDPA